MKEKLIVLHVEEWNPDSYSRGIVLKRLYGDDEAFFCQYMETASTSTVDLDDLEPGDIIEATLIPQRKVPLANWHYDDFDISDIKFINKISWINLK